MPTENREQGISISFPYARQLFDLFVYFDSNHDSEDMSKLFSHSLLPPKKNIQLRHSMKDITGLKDVVFGVVSESLGEDSILIMQ